MTQPFRLQLGLQQPDTRPRATPGLAGTALADRFIGHLRTSGLTNPYALAAVAATGQHESGWSAQNVYGEWSDPSERGAPGRSGGALSWRNERLGRLRSFARAIGDNPQRPSIETQAEFFRREDPALWNALQNARSVEEAQSLMNNAWRFAGYNRPGGEAARRLATARSLLPMFGDGEAAPQQASADGFVELPRDEALRRRAEMFGDEPDADGFIALPRDEALRRQQQWQEANQPTVLGDLGRGLAMGWRGVQQGYYGTLAMLSDDPETQQHYLDQYQQLADETKASMISVPEFTEIGSVGDAVMWAIGQTGMLAPIVGSIMAGGAAGGKTGGMVGAALGPKGALAGAFAGSVTGSFSVGYMLYAGDIYATGRQALGAGHDDARDAALLYGAPASAVSIVVPMGVLASITGHLGKDFVKHRAKRMLQGAGMSAPAEGVAEAIAESFVIMGEEAMGATLTDEEKRNRIINAGAAGGLMGAGLGSVGGAGRQTGSVDTIIDAFLDQAEQAHSQGDRRAVYNHAIETLEAAESRTADQEAVLDYLKTQRAQASRPLNRETAEIQRAALAVARRSPEENVSRAQALAVKKADGSLTGEEAVELTAIFANSPAARQALAETLAQEDAQQGEAAPQPEAPPAQQPPGPPPPASAVPPPPGPLTRAAQRGQETLTAAQLQPGTPVRIVHSDGEQLGVVEGYAEGWATVTDETGETYDVPVETLQPLEAPQAPVEAAPSPETPTPAPATQAPQAPAADAAGVSADAIRRGRDEKYGIDVEMEQADGRFTIRTSDPNQGDRIFSHGLGGVFLDDTRSGDGYILNMDGEFVPPTQIVQAGRAGPEGRPFKGSREQMARAIELAAELEFARQTGNTERRKALEGALFDFVNNPDGAPAVSEARPDRPHVVQAQQAIEDARRRIGETLTPGDGTRATPVEAETAQDLAAAAQRIDTEATPAQLDAGNARLGHARVGPRTDRLDVSIETGRGQVRRSTDPENPWEVVMPVDYGRIKGTVGADGDMMDIFVGDQPTLDTAFVIHQHDAETGEFDEHKVMVGFPSEEAAIEAYEASFSDGKGRARLGSIEEMSWPQLRGWLDEQTETNRARLATPAQEGVPGRAEVEAKTEPDSPAEADAAQPAEQVRRPAQAARRPRPEGPPPKKPVTQMLKELGGVDPASPLAGELRHMGIGPREAPGLFRRGGRTAVDNIPADEHPIFRDHADPSSGYIDAQAILDALRDEYFQQPWRTEAQREVETAAQQAEEEARARDEILEVAREHGLERDSEVIERALLLYAEGHSPDDAVELAATQLGAEQGAEDRDRTSYEQDAGIPFDPPTAEGDPAAVGGALEELPAARPEGEPGPGEAAPVQAGEPDAGAGQDAVEPAAEPGADGLPQLTIPGTEPISAAEQGQRGADAPLRPDVAQQPMDEGLFGDSAGQMDLVDMTRAPEAAAAPPAPSAATPQIALARRLAEVIAEDGKLSQRALIQEAERAYGGTLAEGAFNRHDAHEALELAVNLRVANDVSLRAVYAGWQNPHQNLEKLLARLPAQRVRSEEQESFQQFSTPPHYALAAAYVANPRPGDVVLEPSAGTGSLVAAAVRPDVTFVANELDASRAAMLREVVGERGRVFTENAEQINNVLPADVRPTLVIMNPPFSQTAGRLRTKDVTVGAQHIEQALKRLEPGGRLVAIVGRGMTMGAPRFKQWWQKIGRDNAVRANIGVDGSVYSKYGTTFGTRLLVIDKVPPSGEPPVLADVTSVSSELMELLEGLRDARPPIPAGERQPAQPSGVASAEGGEGLAAPGQPARPATGTVGTGPGSRGRVAAPRPAGDRDAGRPDDGLGTGERDGVAGQQPERPGRPGRAGAGTDAGPADGRPGDRGVAASERDLQPDAGGRGGAAASGERVALEQAAPGTQAAASELTDSLYESYQPQRVRVKDAQPHPGPLVQSAAMASVAPPAPTYAPSLPPNVVKDGLLSLAQLEAVIYAGQAHQAMLPAGEGEVARRRGHFIGDGTGVGKGREVAGIILDNWNQGRTRAVWLSEKQTLLEDARRDWGGIGQDPKLIFNVGKVKTGEPIEARQGIAFVTYDTLKGGMSDQAALAQAGFVRRQRVTVHGQPGMVQSVRKGARGQPAQIKVRFDDGTTETFPANQVEALEKATVKSRVDQLVEWLGEDFDGVIAFDEAHNMGNAVQQRGARGQKDPALKALAGIELQERLPNARIVYVSATGATEVANLAYADRLGLWGRGTPFAGRAEFVSSIEQGGIAAMELVARDMKQMGLYTARSLSYEGVEYERVEHTLDGEQREIYNTLAEAWQGVLQNFHAALETTEGDHNAQAKSAAMSAFWGAHQRFFNQIITSMQMPSVIRAVEADLAEGRQAVLQLTNTNEASQERAAAKARTAEDIEDLDITPRDAIIQLVERSFPTQQYEEFVNDDGTVSSRPVVDSDGNPVENREAVAMREALIDQLAAIRVPQGPLDMVLDHFGIDTVAEVTGRKRRFVLKEDPETGQIRRREESRPGSANLAESEAFQAGKKRILVFSEAGGTGRSYHADNQAASKDARRAHYLVQAGWRADKAVQGFGRTHRTNQASAPIFKLVTTDLKGQKRFISSIARRLAQLGALTKGQRQAGDQGMFSARDNLESTEAREALAHFYTDLAANRVEGITITEFEQQTGLSLLQRDQDGGSMGLRQELPPIEQFLNRLLSMKIDQQNLVFDALAERIDDVIEARSQAGLLDVGVETIRADRIAKSEEQTVHTLEETGAETKYVKLKLSNRFQPRDFDRLRQDRGIERWTKSPQGRVYAVESTHGRTASTGHIIDEYRLHSPTADSRLVPRRNLDELRSKWEDVSVDEARRLWEAETAAAPEFIDRDMHLITGAILPIWDRLGGSPRVVRLQTDEGERLLGRVVPPSQIAETLRKLGAEAGDTKVGASDLFQALLAGGRAKLSNDWTLKRSLVAGEHRIELIGPASFSEGEQVKRDGVFTERIDYKLRYFVPVDRAAGERTLAALTEFRPVVSLDGDRDIAAGSTVPRRRPAAADQAPPPGGVSDSGVEAGQTAVRAPAPPFYSVVLRTVENAKIARGTPEQWIGWLKKQPGVKQEELDWIGLEAWLREQTGRVTRDQVADFVRANQIEVREVHRREGGDDAEVRAWHDISEEAWAELDDREQAELRSEFMADAAFEPEGDTAFQEHTLPGGENYRELLLTLPGEAETFAAYEGDEKVSPDFRTAAEARSWARQNAKGFSIRQSNDPAPTFRSPHWDEPNVLAHVRFNDRTIETHTPEQLEDIGRRMAEAVGARDPANVGSGAPDTAIRKGAVTRAEAAAYSRHRGFRHLEHLGPGAERVLFIEEIQSDWHQAGRKRGYRGGPMRLTLGESPVPDAPFKTSWPELALKRMIRHAAEHGYDRIAWTPGDVQAERYDLSKHVDAIHVIPHIDGGRFIDVRQGSGEESRSVLDARFEERTGRLVDDPSKTLADLVGKEMADKILASEGSKAFSGLDLKVGGEGMRAFYDRLLVNAANKLGKKWGAKVATTKIGAAPLGRFDITNTGSRWQLVDRSTGERIPGSPMFRSGAEAESWVRENQQLDVWTLPITPQMREAAMEGLPLFASVPRVKIDAERQARLEEALTATITQIAGKEVNISLEPTIPLGEIETARMRTDMARFDEAGGERGETAGGFARVGTSGSAFIRLATADPVFDPMDSAFHEAYHIVEGLLLTDAEFATVTNERSMAATTELAAQELGDATAAAAMPGYEIRATAFQRYARLRDEGQPISRTRLPRPVALFFEKLRRAIAAVRRVLTGEGYTRWEDVFEAAYQGEMADRPRQFRDFVEAGATVPRETPAQAQQRREAAAAEAAADIIVGRTEATGEAPHQGEGGTLAQSNVRLPAPWEDAGAVQRFFESVTDRLRRADNPVLTELATRIDRYYDQREARVGMVNGRVRPILKKLGIGPVTRQAKVREITQPFAEYWRHWDNGRHDEAEAVLREAPPAVAELVAEVKRLYSDMGDENQAVGVKVYDHRLRGWRPIGKVREGEFWPRALRPEVQRVLQNPNNDPALWDALVDALIDEGHIESRDEADQFIRNYFSDEITNDYFAGIEKARGRKLPELFYDYSWDNFQRYAWKWSGRISQIEQFGQHTGPKTTDAFDRAIGATLDRNTQDYIAQARDVVYGWQKTDLYLSLVDDLNILATAIQLGNPATATLNFIGGTTLNVQMFGWRRVARAYLELVRDWGRVQQTGVQYGILGKDVLNLLRDQERTAGQYFDVAGKKRDALSAFARFTMMWGGYRGTENIIRANAMLAGWMQLQDALTAWNANPTSTTSLKYRAFMQRNRIDADALLAENGQGPETARYLRLMVNIPQGSYRIDQTPLFVDTRLGRFLFKYQKFGTQVSRMFWQNHLRPFVAAVQGGETVRVADDEKRVKAFLPLFRYFVAAFIGGSAILAARQAMFNYQDPGVDWDDLRAALEDDERALTWAMIFDRAFYSLMAASAGGFFGNYIQFGLDFRDQQRTKNPLEPPGLASIDAVKELVLRWHEQGTLTARDLDQIGERTLALYRGYKRMGLSGLSLAGSEWHEARLQAARRDVNYIRKATRRYADETGIEQRRTASGRFGRTPRTPIINRVSQALLLGDAQTARAIIREAERGLSAADRRTLRASLQAGIRARQPIMIAGGGSDAERAAFLRWARRNLSRSNFQRVQEAHQRYRRAAIAAGLMRP